MMAMGWRVTLWVAIMMSGEGLGSETTGVVIPGEELELESDIGGGDVGGRLRHRRTGQR